MQRDLFPWHIDFLSLCSLKKKPADAATSFRKLQGEGKVAEGESERWSTSKSLDKSTL